LDGNDIIPVFNQYVGYGDMVAADEVTAMLASIEFADLRKAQTLPIGAVTNRWMMQLQQAWRHRLNWTPG
jgi:hypothetical protein